MDFHNGDDVANLAATLGLGGVLTKLIDLVIARRRAQAAQAPAIVKASADFQDAVSHAARDLLEDYRRQLGFVREHCDRLQAELDTARAESAAALREHADCRIDLDKLRAEIEALKTASGLFAGGGGP